MGFLDKAMQAAKRVDVDKAKGYAKQAQQKLDELQSSSNAGQAKGAGEQDPAPVEYDKHGRPIAQEPPAGTAPGAPGGGPVAAPGVPQQGVPGAAPAPGPPPAPPSPAAPQGAPPAPPPTDPTGPPQGGDPGDPGEPPRMTSGDPLAP